MHVCLTPQSSPAPVLDPRVARSRAAILRATASLLIESGASGVTIEGIADRSGVARTTIYRHWSSRSQLIFDAFENLLEPGPGVPCAGSIREQLEAVLSHLVRALTSSDLAPAVAPLVDAAARDPELRQLVHDFLAERTELGRSVLHAAIGQGEFGPDLAIEDAVSMLVGPIFYRRLISQEPLDDRFVAALVEQFVRGARRES